MMITGIQINQKQTFENFEITQANQFAYSVAYDVTKFPFTKPRLLYLYGDNKSGKTHLLNAIANSMLEFRVEFTTGRTFCSDFISALRNDKLMSFTDKYWKSTDVLIVDDIQTFFFDETIEAELLNIFDFLFELRKKVIIAGNLDPQCLSKMSEKLGISLKLGIAAEIKPRYVQSK